MVKQQIIQLAKLCRDIPLNICLKATGEIILEFWLMPYSPNRFRSNICFSLPHLS